MIEQGSPEWFEQRRGKVTASRIADIMTRTKSGYSSSRKNYMAQLICERLTGRVAESYQSEAMRHGTETEPKARAVYMLQTGEIVEQTGMIPHPEIPDSGASPDGLIGADGLIEIKCPNTATHIDFIKTRQPKREYILQMQWQMACTGRQWCDFVSYDDRLPENLAYRSIRIFRDDTLIAAIETEVRQFLDELDREIQALTDWKDE